MLMCSISVEEQDAYSVTMQTSYYSDIPGPDLVCNRPGLWQKYPRCNHVHMPRSSIGEEKAGGKKVQGLDWLLGWKGRGGE